MSKGQQLQHSCIPRPGFGSSGKPINLLTNHFPLIFHSGTVFHFDVDIRACVTSSSAAAAAAAELPCECCEGTDLSMDHHYLTPSRRNKKGNEDQESDSAGVHQHRHQFFQGIKLEKLRGSPRDTIMNGGSDNSYEGGNGSSGSSRGSRSLLAASYANPPKAHNGMAALCGGNLTKAAAKKLRKTTYKINRQVIRHLFQRCAQLSEGGLKYPVYDGNKNLYTVDALDGVGEEERSMAVVRGVWDSEMGRYQDFIVTIKLVGRVDLGNLAAFYENKLTQVPHEAIQVLDIILRNGPSISRIPIGQSFYSPKEDQFPFMNGYGMPGVDDSHRYPPGVDDSDNDDDDQAGRKYIGYGKELAFGHYQSVRPSMRGTLLCVDRAVTVFYKEGSILQFVGRVLSNDVQTGEPDMSYLKRPRLNVYERKKIEKEIRGLKVQVSHLQYKRKYKVLGITKKVLGEIEFYPRPGSLNIKNEYGADESPVQEGKAISLVDYFWLVYRKKLEFTHLPCLVVGREKYLPMELCSVAPDQVVVRTMNNKQASAMIKGVLNQTPEQRFECIQSAVVDVMNDGWYWLPAYGIQLSHSPLALEGRVLSPPVLRFRDGEELTPEEGSWNVIHKRLYNAKNMTDWVVINFAESIVYGDVVKLATALIYHGGELGMKINLPMRAVHLRPNKHTMVQEIKTILRECNVFPQLILFIIPPDNQLYKFLKMIGDVMFGVASQCIVARNVKRFSSSLIINVLLKINTKLGGQNSVLKKTNDGPKILSTNKKRSKVMIVGADVTHPAACEKMVNVSVVATVASLDKDFTNYTTCVRVQENKEKEDRELIKDFESMFIEMCKEYQKTNQYLPGHIIVYRDGVSEGQFLSVGHREINAARSAIEKLQQVNQSWRPQLTFLVVQKRHHVRFMPKDTTDGVGEFANVPPGTTVDKDVTHPLDFDFFLCSHFGIKGTSRPTRYNILFDDGAFSADDLQKLTYYLCHVYGSCTRSISIPTPVQYAHLAAYRARQHIVASFGRGPLTYVPFVGQARRDAANAAEEANSDSHMDTKGRNGLDMLSIKEFVQDIDEVYRTSMMYC